MALHPPQPETQSPPDVAAIITAMTDSEQPFLARTLRSVLQDPGIAQVIVCVEERSAWAETTIAPFRDDDRLRVLPLPMMLLGAVRNRALALVEHPWIAYCDGDDLWCRGKTMTQRAIAARGNCAFVGADHCLIDEADRRRAVALARYIPMPSSWLVKTEVMERYPFSESLVRGTDGEWWSRTAKTVQKVRCPQILLRYRVRSGSLSSPTPSKSRKSRIVRWAQRPILGWVIWWVTYGLWWLTRRNDYVWLSSWGADPRVSDRPSEP